MSRKPVKRGDRNKAWRSSVRQGSPRYRTVQMTRHLVVTEGTETEPRYFNGMRLLLGEANGRKVNAVVRSTGKHTMGLLEYAKEACRRSPDVYDHVWLVYDKDDFSDEEFDRVEALCQQTTELATYHALWSNPCFEIWLLEHLRYTTAPMDSASCCKALSDALKREFGILYKKNMDGMSELLFAKLEVARANALKLRRHHANIGNDTPSSQCPCTNVDAIFEVMGEFLSPEGGGKDRGDWR